MIAHPKLLLPLLRAEIGLALQSLTSRMRTLQRGPQQLVRIYVAHVPITYKTSTAAASFPPLSLIAQTSY